MNIDNDSDITWEFVTEQDEITDSYSAKTIAMLRAQSMADHINTLIRLIDASDRGSDKEKSETTLKIMLEIHGMRKIMNQLEYSIK